MRAHLLGVRGSVPTPGAPFSRYGGNTSCVAISHDDGPPSLVLDAGTGVRALSTTIGDIPFDGTILLTHLHWDHLEGLPFCSAIDRDDARCDLYLPAQPGGAGASATISRMMSPPNFPIGPEDLRGRWTFSTLEPGTHQMEQFSVTAVEVAHKGGRTFGYRISDGTSSLAYLPDHCPTEYGPGPEGLGDYPGPIMALVGKADVLIHDAQITADQLPDEEAYGHSAMEYAVALGARACVSTVLLFHHGPRRSDDMLDAVAERYRRCDAPSVKVAVEGTVLQC